MDYHSILLSNDLSHELFRPAQWSSTSPLYKFCKEKKNLNSCIKNIELSPLLDIPLP